MIDPGRVATPYPLVALLSVLSCAQPTQESACLATAQQTLFHVIDPETGERHPFKARGAHPVWLVDGSLGRWRGSAFENKMAWVVARDRQGDLLLEARRRDGGDRALLSSGDGRDHSTHLVIRDAHTVLIVPGGAPGDAVRDYAFRSSSVVFPSAGCWDFEVGFGTSRSRITLELTPGDSVAGKDGGNS